MSAVPIPDDVPAEAWAGYVAMRKLMKKPLTEGATRRALRDLAALVALGQDAEAVLNQSEDKCWLGLFAVTTPVPFVAPQLNTVRRPLALVDQQAANTAAAERELFGFDEGMVIDEQR